MDKILGNYLTQDNRDFPMDCETLDYMAKHMAMTEMLGNIAGDKVILRGCELNTQSRQRSEGYVFLRTTDFPQGEVLRFEGGDNESGMYVNKQDVPVTADGYSYPKAYTRRSLVAGLGTEHYSWDDFTEVQTNRELHLALTQLNATVQALVGEPLGIVKMWAGTQVPNGYHLCDGSELSKEQYPALYAAIGNAFNSTKDADGNTYTTQTGYFRLPDLSGRFIVGYRSTDSEYSQYGNADGEKKHKLKVEELPEHSHSKSVTPYDPVGRDFYGDGKVAAHGNDTPQSPFTWTSGKTGDDVPHENRPPYYVLAYIMKLQ